MLLSWSSSVLWENTSKKNTTNNIFDIWAAFSTTPNFLKEFSAWWRLFASH